MNWVGGARNRVKFQGDRRLQKVDLERRSLLHAGKFGKTSAGRFNKPADVQCGRVELPFSPELVPSKLDLLEAEAPRNIAVPTCAKLPKVSKPRRESSATSLISLACGSKQFLKHSSPDMSRAPQTHPEKPESARCFTERFEEYKVSQVLRLSSSTTPSPNLWKTNPRVDFQHISNISDAGFQVANSQWFVMQTEDLDGTVCFFHSQLDQKLYWIVFQLIQIDRIMLDELEEQSLSDVTAHRSQAVHRSGPGDVKVQTQKPASNRNPTTFQSDTDRVAKDVVENLVHSVVLSLSQNHRSSTAHIPSNIHLQPVAGQGSSLTVQGTAGRRLMSDAAAQTDWTVIGVECRGTQVERKIMVDAGVQWESPPGSRTFSTAVEDTSAKDTGTEGTGAEDTIANDRSADDSSTVPNVQEIVSSVISAPLVATPEP
ncbi:hypothetical protein BaRGS_00034607 [Batillaria attramentaria]|uniref:Uncharacterized protein n=1 Tax=Batillaria attramentaria TaxID=370345 RepID=A0ABD0JGY9_9CAEN